MSSGGSSSGGLRSSGDSVLSDLKGEEETLAGVPDLYILVTGSDREFSSERWYVIPSGAKSGRRKSLKEFNPLPGQRLPNITHSSYAAIGSKIYMSGGHINTFTHLHERLIRDCYVVDTCEPLEGWKQAAPMIATRGDHCSFFDDKRQVMYVIGGSPIENESTLYSEVYDPEEDKWTEILRLPHEPDKDSPVPLVRPTGHAIFEVEHKKPQIMFHTLMTNVLCSIDVASKSVKVLDETFGGGKVTSAMVDRVLYYLLPYAPRSMFAYEPFEEEGNRHSRVIFLKRDEDVDRNLLPCRLNRDELIPTSRLVPLGGDKLAVIWANEFYCGRRGNSLRIHCSKFQMLKVRNKEEDLLFVARPLHYSNYVVPHGLLYECLAVWPSHDVCMEQSGDKDAKEAMTYNPLYERKRKKVPSVDQ